MPNFEEYLITQTPNHPRFFPQPTSFTYCSSSGATPSTVSFIYLRSLKKAAPIYLVETEDKQKLVVKFVPRYGAEAHYEAAKHGFAPNLHYAGPLYKNIAEDCQATMVVMDWVEGETVDGLTEEQKNTLRTHIRELHEAGFVHGDIRPPNVLIRDDKVTLLDFDWAGPEAKVFYPPDSTLR